MFRSRVLFHLAVGGAVTIIRGLPSYPGFVRSMTGPGSSDTGSSGAHGAVATPVAAQIAIVMGSQSDWETMSEAAAVLGALDIACDVRIVSAHRTPHRMVAFAEGARAAGFKVIIAGAGGAAHLPGMIAAMTSLPVLGVPVESKALKGMDSLLSIAQMPGGVPVGTLAIGKAGAKNAGLLAAAILGTTDPDIADRLDAWRQAQTEAVADRPS